MKRIVNLISVLLIAGVLSACSATVDEPCMYCNNRPSKEYAMSDGSKVYVCEECSSECMFCNKKATKHYESLLGVVFVCSECYKDVVAE